MVREEFLLVDDREVVITPDLKPACDGTLGAGSPASLGGMAALGHPIEYLTLEKGGQTRCKYCGRRYVHTTHPEAEELRGRGETYPGSTPTVA